jgi:serine/threonine protein phosphatase PrpC
VKGPMKNECQDRFTFVPRFTREDKQVSANKLPCTFTAVFDGHSGFRTADMASIQLPGILSKDNELWDALDGSEEEPSAMVSRCLKRAFLAMDAEVLRVATGTPRFDGCTAIAGLQRGRVLYVANAGDSRAVLCRAGTAMALSRDHKPSLKAERDRIELAGGMVMNVRGEWRVLLPSPDGKGARVCAVSRALGDPDFKTPNPLLTADPEVSATVLQPGQDEFVIYASDGLWGFVNDQDAVDAACRELQALSSMRSSSRQSVALGMARALMKLAKDCGSMDDITVVVQLLDYL